MQSALNLRSLLAHRELMWETARRELADVNRGSLLGMFWLVINPLVQVAVYVFIVAVITGGRFKQDQFGYALYVLSGFVPWQFITRVVQAAPSLLQDKLDLVKQVVYPIETLAVTRLVVSGVSLAVGLAVYLVLAAAAGELRWTAILLPIPLALLTLFLLGTAWFLSIVGVIIRDIREVIGILLMLMIYLTPVLIRESMVDPRIWRVLMLNPLSHIIVAFRDVFSAEFHPTSWMVFAFLTTVALMLGGWMMERMKLAINEYI